MGNIIADVEDLAKEGLSLGGDEARLDEIIVMAEQAVEQITGFRFYSFAATYVLDGSGSHILSLPQPAISLTSVTEDGSSLVSGTDYVLYNRRLPGADDRYRPRLERVVASDSWSAWAGTPGPVWALGQQNVSLVGTFGFTTLSGVSEVCPPEVRRALIRLIVFEAARVGASDEAGEARAKRYGAQFTAGDVTVNLNDVVAFGKGQTGDPVVDSVLMRYRHPSKGARPAFAFGVA